MRWENEGMTSLGPVKEEVHLPPKEGTQTFMFTQKPRGPAWTLIGRAVHFPLGGLWPVPVGIQKHGGAHSRSTNVSSMLRRLKTN